jgi:hypothetical protein
VWELQQVRPWHKFASYLIASGKTVRAVAQQLGKGESAVSNLMRQEWFKTKVDEIVAERGMNVMDALTALQHKAVSALERILDNPDSSPASVVAAVDTILDRIQGKPTVRVESTVVHSDDPVAEYNCLLSESKALWAEHERTQPPRPLPGPSNGER